MRWTGEGDVCCVTLINLNYYKKSLKKRKSSSPVRFRKLSMSQRWTLPQSCWSLREKRLDGTGCEHSGFWVPVVRMLVSELVILGICNVTHADTWEALKEEFIQISVCGWVKSDLILKASAEDQTVVLYFVVARQFDMFGLAIDGLHLVRHNADPGTEGQLGVILRAVAVTVEKHIHT